MDKATEKEIDIKRIIKELLYKCWIIILAAFIGASTGFVYSNAFVTPLYTAKAMMYVNNFANDVQDAVIRMTNSDIYTSQALVKTYMTFITSDRVLAEVEKDLGYKYTTKEIRDMMKTGSVDDTEIFTISITHKSPKEAEEITNKIADRTVSIIGEYIEGSTVKIIDRATVPNGKSYPSVSRFTMLGGMAAGGMAAIIIILLYLFNGKVTSEDDLKALFDAPIIGRIPNFRQIYGNGYSYNYAYKYGYGYSEKSKKKVRKQKMRRNSNSGITLIALVVTIIVLLILAGIGIMMLTGNDGILAKAGLASEKNRDQLLNVNSFF